MLKFPLKLTTIADFQKYSELFEEFCLSGLIQGSGFLAEADDILEILFHYPADNLYLFLDESCTADTSAIENFLANSGLLDIPRLAAFNTGSVHRIFTLF